MASLIVGILEHPPNKIILLDGDYHSDSKIGVSRETMRGPVLESPPNTKALSFGVNSVGLRVHRQRPRLASGGQET